MSDELLVCSVHGGTEVHSVCDDWIVYCSAWDGEFDENDYPTCRYPELEK